MSGKTSIQPEPFGEANSQPLSPMEVSDDEQDEELLKLNEDELRELQQVNSIVCIKLMRLTPKEASQFDIPLCRMVYIPLVRPHLPTISTSWRFSSLVMLVFNHKEKHIVIKIRLQGKLNIK
jgi:hypothetical protein